MQTSLTYLIFDLETVPDYRLYEPPVVADGAARPIAPTYAQIPIAIGVLWLDAELTFKKIGIVGEGAEEPEMLADFVSFIDRHTPLLVTYNGRCFDLPVVAHRSLHHGLSMPWYYKKYGYRYRYSDEGHLDLCDFLADHGAARRLTLDAAARLIGLPGKVGVDGSQVEALYRAGKMETIRRYCLHDVVQTAFLLLRFRLLQGNLTRQTYCEAARRLFEALEAEERVQDLLEAAERDRLLLPEKSPDTC
jgi:hypothetical protein